MKGKYCEKEAYKKALEKINYEEGVVIGSYIGELEKLNRELTARWIESLTFNLEMMDEVYPMWRFHAKNEIDQLKKLLK